MVNLVQRGNRWYADIYYPSTGKRVKRSLKTSDKKEAERIFESVLKEFDKITHGYSLSDLMRLYESADTNPRYLAAKIDGSHYTLEYAKHVETTTRSIRDAVHKKNPKLLDKRIKDITQADCKHVRQYIYEAYGATRKAQSAFTQFKAMFSQSVQEGWIPFNPCALIKGINYKKKPRFSFEPEVINAILSIKSICKSHEEWTYVAMLATTGMRKSEILALNKEQIYNGTLTIDRSVKSDDKDDIQDPKWGVIRVIPLANIAQDILSDITPGSNGRYFYRSRHWAADAISHVKKTAMLVFPEYSEQLSKMTCHILRHSMTTNLVSTGRLSDTFISEYLGWEHQHMLLMQRNYTHLKASHLTPVANEIDMMYSLNKAPLGLLQNQTGQEGIK